MDQSDYRSRIEGVLQGEAYGESLFRRPCDDLIDSERRWWEIFGDQEMNSLEGKSIFRTRMWAAFAGFITARAVVRQARSQYFPAVTVGLGISCRLWRALHAAASHAK